MHLVVRKFGRQSGMKLVGCRHRLLLMERGEHVDLIGPKLPNGSVDCILPQLHHFSSADPGPRQLASR